MTRIAKFIRRLFGAGAKAPRNEGEILANALRDYRNGTGEAPMKLKPSDLPPEILEKFDPELWDHFVELPVNVSLPLVDATDQDPEPVSPNEMVTDVLTKKLDKMGYSATHVNLDDAHGHIIHHRGEEDDESNGP